MSGQGFKCKRLHCTHCWYSQNVCENTLAFGGRWEFLVAPFDANTQARTRLAQENLNLRELHFEGLFVEADLLLDAVRCASENRPEDQPNGIVSMFRRL
jgi:hypothetical protein